MFPAKLETVQASRSGADLAMGDNMRAHTIDLLEDEEIVFESDQAVLTNRRLVAWKVDNPKPFREALVKDITRFEKISGGQENRIKPGLTSGALGIVLVAIQVLLPDAVSAIKSVMFLFGALGIIVGLHFISTTLLRLKPHTTVLFDVPGSKEIPVSFPGRDNPNADDLTRGFTRAKRGF